MHSQKLLSPAVPPPPKKPRIIILSPPPSAPQPTTSNFPILHKSIQSTSTKIEINSETLKSREEILAEENAKLRQLCAQLTEKLKQENDYQLQLKVAKQEKTGFNNLPRSTKYRIIDEGWNLLKRTYGSMANDIAVAIYDQKKLKVIEKPKIQEIRKNFKVLKTKFKRHEASHEKQIEKLKQGHEEKVKEFAAALTASKEETLNCKKLLAQAKDRELNDAEIIKHLKEKYQRIEAESSKKNDKIVELKVNGKYTDNAKLVFAKIKESKVADENVGEIIKAVLSLADLEANALPSARTVAQSNQQTKM